MAQAGMTKQSEETISSQGGSSQETNSEASTSEGSRSEGTGSDEGTGRENEIYTSRFSSEQERTRGAVWKVLVEKFFQPFVSSSAVVVDVGAGDGHFITRIKSKRRIAVDLSEHVQRLREHDVEVLQVPATEYADLLDEKADVVFMSNFLEHLPDKRVLLEVLEETRRALKPGGSLMILQPNIRYVGSAYWDYVDHHIALTEHSLQEALEVSGFKVVKMIPRFLPYTAKSRLGSLVSKTGFLSGSDSPDARIIEWYLKVPFLWKIFGQQTFVVATPNELVL